MAIVGKERFDDIVNIIFAYRLPGCVSNVERAQNAACMLEMEKHGVVLKKLALGPRVAASTELAHAICTSLTRVRLSKKLGCLVEVVDHGLRLVRLQTNTCLNCHVICCDYRGFSYSRGLNLNLI